MACTIVFNWQLELISTRSDLRTAFTQLKALMTETDAASFF